MEKVGEPAAIAQDVLIRSLTKICQDLNDVEVSVPFECNQKFSSVEQRLDQRSPIIKKFLLDLAKKYETPGGSVLDVACGPGYVYSPTLLHIFPLPLCIRVPRVLVIQSVHYNLKLLNVLPLHL